MTFGNVGGSWGQPQAAQGPYQHGDKLPDGSNYVDYSKAAGYDQSKGWGGVTGEVNGGVYRGMDNAPSQYANPDTSWIGGTTGGFGTGGTAPGNPYGAVMQPSGAPSTNAQFKGPASAGGWWGGGGSAGGPTGYAPGGRPQPGMTNPYMSAQAQSITNRVTDNMQRRILPSLGIGAMQAGQYGSSRQGVLEANAIKDMNQGLGDSLASLYGGAYQFDQGNATTQRGQDLGYKQGMTSLDNQFFLGNRQLDQSDKRLGMDMFQQGNSGQWDAINQANRTYSPYTGLGTTSNSGPGESSGDKWGRILGTGMTIADLGRNMGWWGGA